MSKRTISCDERDTLFARLRLIAGTREYLEYYHRHPERQEADDALRECGGLARLGTAGGWTIDQLKEMTARPTGRIITTLVRVLPPVRDTVSRRAAKRISRITDRLPIEPRIQALLDDSTRTIEDYAEADRRRTPAAHQVDIPPGRMSAVVKEASKFYGASLVGITRMENDLSYTHRSNGEPVSRSFAYSIVYAVEMPRELINRAPHRETLLATCNGYVDAARVGARLSGFIKSLGYKTSLNSMVKYDVPLVPLAERAGLGQRGRCHFIVTKEYGNRVRLGAVLTNLPLEADDPSDFGLHEFCRLCGKCATNCPGKAISLERTGQHEDGPAWTFDEIRCMRMWIEYATDCAICIASCPFTQGVSAEQIAAMKNRPGIMKDILREDRVRHGDRAFIQKEAPIVNWTASNRTSSLSNHLSNDQTD